MFFNPGTLKTVKVKSREQKTREGRSVVCFYYGKRKFYCCEGFQALPACPFGNGRLEAKMNIAKRRRKVMGSGLFDNTTQKMR